MFKMIQSLKTDKNNVLNDSGHISFFKQQNHDSEKILKLSMKKKF